MNPYHPRGYITPFLREPAIHLWRLLNSPEYRVLQKMVLRYRISGRNKHGTVRYRGLPIHYLDTASFISAWDEIFLNQIYDIGPVSSVPMLIDVGANIGLAQVYWQKRYGKFSSIAFEPDPAICETLRNNLKDWGCETVVEQAAVAAVRGSASFSQKRGDSGHLSDPSRPAGSEISVPTVLLSGYLDREVDLLKIDAEGSELAILSEAALMLGRVKRLFVEFHSIRTRKQELGELCKILESAGFRYYLHPCIVPDAPFLGEIRDYDGIDMAINIYATR